MLVALLSTTPEVLIPKLERLALRAAKMGIDWSWQQIDGVTYIQRHVPYRWTEDGAPSHWRLEMLSAARIEVAALPSVGSEPLLLKYTAILRETEPGDARGVWMISTLDYVAAALASVERRGYRKSSDLESTRSDVAWLCGPEPQATEIRKIWRSAQPTPAQRIQAEVLIAWAQGLTKGYDYELTLRDAALLPVATPRTRGLLASLPVAYAKANQELVKKQNPDEEVDPGYFAPLHARVDATVTILRMLPIPSDWGDRMLYVFRSATGHDLVWFCSGRTLHTADGSALDVGATVKLSGTVKRHDLRKGRHQTVLIRVKLQSVEQDGAA